MGGNTIPDQSTLKRAAEFIPDYTAPHTPKKNNNITVTENIKFEVNSSSENESCLQLS